MVATDPTLPLSAARPTAGPDRPPPRLTTIDAAVLPHNVYQSDLDRRRDDVPRRLWEPGATPALLYF